MGDMGQALNILVTGLVVVFAVLIVLIVIIKLYGTIVYNAQNKKKAEERKQIWQKPLFPNRLRP